MAHNSGQPEGGNPAPPGSKTNPLHIIGTIEQTGDSPPPKKQQTNLWLVLVTLLLSGLLTYAIVELFIHQLYPLAVLLMLIAFGGLVLLGYISKYFAWTGFGQYLGPEDRDHQPKMLWDWLTLLIIPIVLAAAALGFGAFQNQENYKLSQDQFHLAATQYLDAQQLALENTFQTYLDRMTDLLTNPHVHEDTLQGDDIRSLATARTLTILPDLSGARKATVLKFLHDAGLITRQTDEQKKHHIINPVVNLNGADFSEVNLSDFRLSGADLAVVNFNGATLNGADLSSAYLMNANLSNAHLKAANMCFASIFGNANLRGADLSGALLGGADLTGADLSGAILDGANLGNNDPTCHALQPPGQKLLGATLTNAHLNGANLSNADLTLVIWKNTTCPDGTNSDKNSPNTCEGH